MLNSNETRASRPQINTKQQFKNRKIQANDKIENFKQINVKVSRIKDRLFIDS